MAQTQQQKWQQKNHTNFRKKKTWKAAGNTQEKNTLSTSNINIKNSHPPTHTHIVLGHKLRSPKVPRTVRGWARACVPGLLRVYHPGGDLRFRSGITLAVAALKIKTAGL